MPLPDELLALASSLANTLVPASSEAIYRRAISTAYYAAFHLLAGAAADGAGRGTLHGLNTVLQRQLGHGQMKKAAEMFARGFDKFPDHLKKIVPDPVPIELAEVGFLFAELQGSRHEADYSRSASFDREDAIYAVDSAKQLFSLWATAISQHPEYSQTFLVALFFDLERKR